jgi:phage shock protein E
MKMQLRNHCGRRWIVIATLVVIGCARGTADHETLSLEQEAWRSIRSGALVVDVRTPEEYAGGHLDGALNIPYDQIEARRAELGTALDRPVVLYCRTGRRAGIAKKTMEALGFTNVLNARSYEALKTAQ